MKPLRKATLSAAIIALFAGASVLWWIHRKESSKARQLAVAVAEERASANGGNTRAAFDLAQRYYRGNGVPQDYAEAARWYRKAAEQGYAKAEFNLGDLYFRGKGVPQDYAEAAFWTQKAADQGDSRAEAGLGYMYSEGLGLSRNYAEAFSWYHKAADQGYAEAEHALGYMYLHGQGVPQSNDEAFRWIERAAMQRDANAELSLGYMYAAGQGVPENRGEALRWYRKSASQGNREARRVVHSLESGSGRQWWELVTALIAIPAGLLFSLESLFRRKRIIRGWRQGATTVMGICFLLCGGMNLYAFVHNGIRYSPHYVSFEIVRFLLTAIAVLIIVTVVLPAKDTAKGH